MSSSDEEEPAIIDGDLVADAEIAKAFTHSYDLSNEEAISLRRTFILHMGNSSDFSRIAAADQLEGTVHLFDLNSTNGLTKLNRLTFDGLNINPRPRICGVKFSNVDSNLLFVGTEDGTIVSHDLRTPDQADSVLTYTNRPTSQRNFICFDLNSNDTVLCAGTDVESKEGHLVFFDIRKNAMIGSYTDSHTNDVTQILFHPNEHNILASGSTDGLINQFNMVEATEDDALEYVLNTESTVQTINFHPKSKRFENWMTCVTSTNDFQLFNFEETELLHRANREDITKFIKRKSSADCYLINAHTTSSGELFLLAGSNSDRGTCLRSLTYNENQSFVARTNFVNNRQIVRCSLYCAKKDILVTAGEGGIISVWENKSNAATPVPSTSSALKESTKHKDHKAKPY